MENNILKLKMEGPTHQFNISESNLHNLNGHNNVGKVSILKLELCKTPAINNLPEAFVYIYWIKFLKIIHVIFIAHCIFFPFWTHNYFLKIMLFILIK